MGINKRKEKCNKQTTKQLDWNQKPISQFLYRLLHRTPLLCQRRRRRHAREQTEAETAEIIRVSLQNLSMLGQMDGASHMMNAMGRHPHSQFGLNGMSVDDRREFIKNMLVCRVCGTVIV